MALLTELRRNTTIHSDSKRFVPYPGNIETVKSAVKGSMYPTLIPSNYISNSNS